MHIKKIFRAVFGAQCVSDTTYVNLVSNSHVFISPQGLSFRLYTDEGQMILQLNSQYTGHLSIHVSHTH